jgi:glycosyltransferase involved in cell wall biosynthesis
VSPAGVRRRVLLVNMSLANGGLERQLLLLARNLPAAWEARLWTLEGGPFDRPFREAGIPWRSRPRRWRYDPTPAFDLWRVMGSWRPDVVHAWHSIPAAAALPACAVLGTPLIDGSIRMGMVPHSRVWPRRSIMCGATRVVANSQAGLDAFRVGPGKGRVVYNAFDDDRLRTSRPTGPPLSGSARRFTAVMAARMAPQKDFGSVIAAARLLERDAPGTWRFLLVGDGEDRESLLAAAQDLVAAGVVTFRNAGLEAIDAIREAQAGILMTAADVWAEGCSNSIMEYMACALPVVCSDTGGSAELVRDGREGYVIAPYDVVALADKLAGLRAHPGLSRSMGAAGRTRIEREFTIDRMVAEYLRVYEEAVGQRRRAR